MRQRRRGNDCANMFGMTATEFVVLNNADRDALGLGSLMGAVRDLGLSDPYVWFMLGGNSRIERRTRLGSTGCRSPGSVTASRICRSHGAW